MTNFGWFGRKLLEIGPPGATHRIGEHVENNQFLNKEMVRKNMYNKNIKNKHIIINKNKHIYI